MKPLSILKSSLLPKTGALFLLPAIVTHACGPDFPNRYLDLPAETILAAPEGFFAVEVERLAPAPKPTPRERGEEKDTRDLDDLRMALMERGDGSKQVEELVSAYECYRLQQKRAAENQATNPERIPADLPKEFSLYLAGAGSWYAGDTEEAGLQWRALLSLPENERRHRSTWAAYMLGRCAADDSSPEEARKWFKETRRLVALGFGDSLNLAGESLGCEAHEALALGDYARAIDFYLDQYATGDESAYASLRIASAGAARVKDLRQRTEIARNPRARAVVAAWFLARFVSGDAERDLTPLHEWTETLARENVHDVDQADRLAWLAYEAGDFKLAKKWAALAVEASPATHWIRGKLALLENRICEGARELSVAATSAELAPIYRSTVLGELGRVQLALDHREAALTAWLDGAHWEDAAYVAERLMTIDDLKLFLVNYRPVDLPLYEPFFGEVVVPSTLNGRQDARSDWRDANSPSLLTQLSELLARRLVRAGRIDEAKIYFSKKNREVLVEYAAEVQTGFNLMFRPKKRAEAFWRAAQIARNEGMTLMGAELDPDFGIWGGSFSSYSGAGTRSKLPPGPFSVTKEEADRLTSISIPTRRFSYRYRAADLAWWAASLLPNDDDQTAEILNTAGTWLKARDPMEANRFYQALVIRCGHTKLGKAAAERRWFASDI